tara:strand:+ start:1008 stop:1880 length:873 start_codon:yes stop_codon:yes gene_type:complete
MIIVPLVSFGQFESTSFTGIIQTADSVVFPYEIHLSRIGGIVSGYSISDRGGAAETKSLLETRKVNNQIYFIEKEIVYTKADYSTFDDFCLVSFNVDENQLFKSNKLNIDFSGYFNDKEPCIDGRLNLTSTTFIEKKISKVERKIDNSSIVIKNFGDSLKLIETKITELKNKIVANQQEIHLKANNIIRFNLNEPYEVFIKDYNIPDGDVIQVKINDGTEKTIEIDETPIYFEIEDTQKTNTIEILGINVGTIPPITSQIIILKKGDKKIIQKIKLDIKTIEKSNIIINF